MCFALAFSTCPALETLSDVVAVDRSVIIGFSLLSQQTDERERLLMGWSCIDVFWPLVCIRGGREYVWWKSIWQVIFLLSLPNFRTSKFIHKKFEYSSPFSLNFFNDLCYDSRHHIIDWCVGDMWNMNGWWGRYFTIPILYSKASEHRSIAGRSVPNSCISADFVVVALDNA